MAVALVVNTKQGGASPITSTPGVNTTGATLQVVCSTTNAGHVLTDSKSNTWNGLTQQGVGFYNLRMFWAGGAGLVNDTAQTYTVTSAGSTIGFTVGAFSGIATTSPLVAQNGTATGSGTSITSGEVLPSQVGDLIITTVGMNGSGSSVVTPAGFTAIDSQSTGSIRNWSAYMIATSTLPVNATWTWTGADFPEVSIAVFKAASGPVRSSWTGVTAATGITSVTM